MTNWITYNIFSSFLGLAIVVNWGEVLYQWCITWYTGDCYQRVSYSEVMSGENENLGAVAGDSSVVIDNRDAEQQNGNSNLSADSAFGSNLQVGSNQAYQTIDRWVVQYMIYFLLFIEKFSVKWIQQFLEFSPNRVKKM